MLRTIGVLALVALSVVAAPRADAAPPVRIAIVDSGADVTHPLLAARIAEAVDCNGADGDPSRCVRGGVDDTGHGTHVAGIVASVAADAELLVVRSLHAECDPDCHAVGRVADVVAGIRWATAAGADVVNLSIDAGVRLDWRDGAIASAIREAWARGTLVVASTGNRGDELDDGDLADVPALFVGALDASGRPADYQNAPGLAQWALLAPGGTAGADCGTGAIESTFPRELEPDGTGCLAGTSMAAAHATGAVAVLVEQGMNNDAAIARLLASADDIGEPGRDGVTGAGALDLAEAASTPTRALPRMSVADPAPLTLESASGAATVLLALGTAAVAVRALAVAARRARPRAAH